ncbi:hypothetical protein [Polaromonas sp. UC242_47]|uniref:hypothetical protein n=1 Tax=Polaromonas sp. UC242_47 TaxID=3374626 RepID=UPI0037AFA374
MKSRLLHVALFLLVALGGCGETADPKTISEISHSILNVKQDDERGKKVVTISIKQGSVFSGGNTTKDVLEGLMAHFQATQFDEVKIIMVETLMDKYGKEFPEPILELTYSREELAKVNFENLVGWHILNLSQPKRIGNLSVHVLQQECAEEGNAKYAAEFCEKALR